MSRALTFLSQLIIFYCYKETANSVHSFLYQINKMNDNYQCKGQYKNLLLNYNESMNYISTKIR